MILYTDAFFFASSFENPKRKRLFSIYLYLHTNNAYTFVIGILTIILMLRTVAKCSCCIIIHVIIHQRNDHTQLITI